MTMGQSSLASKRTLLVLLTALAVASGAARVSAHRLDEFLQAARIGIEPDRVQLEMSLTPGTVVADAVIRDIDADRNGDLSEQEQKAYVSRVLEALTLRVDDSPALQIQATGLMFPDVATLRAGNGAIIVRSEADVSRLTVGQHRLSFRNDNAPASSVYLANALVPESDQVAVTGQQRDRDQRELTIDLVIGAPVASNGRWVWIGLLGACALAAALVNRAGVKP